MHYGPIAEAVEVGLDDITCDDACQQWPELDERVVQHYAELMAEGVRFPPVRAVQDDDGTLWLYDGFKRFEAARRSNHQVIEVEAEPGTRRDAILRSTAANADHGQPRSPDCVRRSLYTLWDDAEWSTMSGREMARQVGVSHTTVQRWHQRYLQERGLVPNPAEREPAPPRPKAPPASDEPPPPREPRPEPEPDGDGWEEHGADETPAERAAREHAEALQRCAPVLGQLAPEGAELLKAELAFQEEIKHITKLLLDKYRQHGGRKRRGPFSARVRWLVECPGMEEALVCLDCGGSGCPTCKGAGFMLRS